MRGERVSIGLRVALAIIAATVFASSTSVAAQETYCTASTTTLQMGKTSKRA